MLVPQQSIRSIELGITRPAIVARLGRPSAVQRGTNDFGPYTELRYRGLRITLTGGAVTQVETTSASDRTPDGAGVGSSEAFLRSHVQGLRCATEAAVRHCHLGAYRAGRVVTDFFLRSGAVWRIVVGRVQD